MTVNVYAGSEATGRPVQTLVAPVSTGNWSVAAPSPLFDGVYTVQASQTDGIGNTGTSTPVTFTVKTTPPLVTLTAPSDRLGTGEPKPTCFGCRRYGAWGPADGGSPQDLYGVYTRQARLSRHSRLPLLVVLGRCMLQVPPSAEGTYTAQATQGDTAGNTGASTANTFTVDTTPPKTTITSAPSGQFLPARSKSTSHPISPTARSSAVSTGRLIQRAPPPTCWHRSARDRTRSRFVRSRGWVADRLPRARPGIRLP